jgi:hypothetical protein
VRATRPGRAEVGLARRRRCPGRGRLGGGDDQWVPLVSHSGGGGAGLAVPGELGPAGSCVVRGQAGKRASGAGPRRVS